MGLLLVSMLTACFAISYAGSTPLESVAFNDERTVDNINVTSKTLEDKSVDHDSSKCLEDNGKGLLPDNDCIDCNNPPKQGCDDGYIMDAFPFNGCTKIKCLKPDHDPSKCLEDNGRGLLPDNDCIDCHNPPKQGCGDGYIMDAFPFNGCTKIRCLKPDHDPSKCLEDNGRGLQPDNDCIDCNNPPKQSCDDGYVMNAFPYKGCIRIICTKPGWNVLLPQTKVGGPWINHGTPKPATIAFKVPNEDTWIIGLHDHVYMKMVKIQITGPNTFTWVASKYWRDGSYDGNCLTSFKHSCFNGRDTIESNYQVQLVAKIE